MLIFYLSVSFSPFLKVCFKFLNVTLTLHSMLCGYLPYWHVWMFVVNNFFCDLEMDMCKNRSQISREEKLIVYSQEMEWHLLFFIKMQFILYIDKKSFQNTCIRRVQFVFSLLFMSISFPLKKEVYNRGNFAYFCTLKSSVCYIYSICK